MNIVLRLSLILGIIVYFNILFYLIRKRSLNLKYTLLWILAGIILFMLSIFPSVMVNITQILGIADVTNGLFTIMLFFVITILMSITSIVSKMKEKNKQLIQQCALLEKRVREIENTEKNIKYKDDLLNKNN